MEQILIIIQGLHAGQKRDILKKITNLNIIIDQNEILLNVFQRDKFILPPQINENKQLSK